MRVSELVELAIGAEQARKVDHAIPQATFDSLPATMRGDIAGWYYDDSAPMFGRLLTQTECWGRIRARVEADELMVVDPATLTRYL